MDEELSGEPGYADPGDSVLFGDILRAPFLLDLFAREDTYLLGGATLPAHLAPKLGGWLQGKLRAEETIVLSDRLPSKEADRYALAHASFGPPGEPRLAMLVSDSCITATALAQGRQKRSPSGRVLFAPINVVEVDKWQTLVDNVDFGRMPLPPDDGFDGYPVAELRHVFMIDAIHLERHLDERLLTCNEPLAAHLEEYWNGYAARRGPLAYERNLLKLAWLLSGAEEVTEDNQAVADKIADVLDIGWRLEGGDLEDVSEAEEEVRFKGANAAERLDPVRKALSGRLREMAAGAEQAADALDATA